MNEQAAKWRRRAGIAGTCLVIGMLSYVINEADGGPEHAMFAGACSLPIICGVFYGFGKALTWAVGRFRPLSRGSRDALTLAPLLLLAGLLTSDIRRARDPIVKFEHWIARPAPGSLRLIKAYQYRGMNYVSWAFHFRIDPSDLPLLLAKHPYQHQVESAGFDLSMVRATAAQAYPRPPADFIAVHRYWFFEPTRRAGNRSSIYANAEQSEFFAYGEVD